MSHKPTHYLLGCGDLLQITALIQSNLNFQTIKRQSRWRFKIFSIAKDEAHREQIYRQLLYNQPQAIERQWREYRLPRLIILPKTKSKYFSC